MAPTIALTIASLKMYSRNRRAVFFSLIVPLVIMGIFGVLNFSAFSSVDVGVVDEARNDASESLLRSLNGADVVEVSLGGRDDQMRAFEEGALDFLLILPDGFGSRRQPAEAQAFLNASQPREARIGAMAAARAFDDLNFEAVGAERLFAFDAVEAAGGSSTYADFLMPGIIAMSVMQTGLIGVTFAVIQYRQQGVLRRLRAAPIHPAHFLAGQVITRLVVSVVQTLVLIGVGVFLLGVDLRGSIAVLVLLAVVGSGLFISMGYAISGFARSEEAAAPITNLVSLPLMFLSGVFFAREHLPGFLEAVTDFSPLTYLAEGMRQVSTGSGIAQVSGDFAGLAVWLALSFFVATRVFRWE